MDKSSSVDSEIGTLFNQQTIAMQSKSGVLDEADLCSTFDDYHSTLARVVIGVVIRSYLDTYSLTPLEILYLLRTLRSLTDRGSIVENALVRVAVTQGRLPGQDQRARRAALQEAINDTSLRARGAQIAFQSLPSGRGLMSKVVELLPDRTPTGDARYDLRYAMASEMADAKTWLGKIDCAIEHLKDDRSRPAADDAMADILGSVNAVQDLLGVTNLLIGPILIQVCGMAFGQSSTATASGRATTLAGMFRQGRLPETRIAILDRVRRQLRSPQPLGRGQAGEEGELLQGLMAYLLTPAGVLGGERMAEALTIRYSRRLEQGGASAFRRSIVGMAEMQSDLFSRGHYLASVARVGAASRHLDEVASAFESALGNEMLIENVLGSLQDVERLKSLIVGVVEAVRTAPLPEAERYAGRMATILDASAKSGQLFQRVRQVEPVARRRILKLAEVACSGLLGEQTGLPPVRQFILDAVKQPDFQKELVAVQSSDASQAEVRQLYALLDRLRQAVPSVEKLAQAAPSPQPPSPQPFKLPPPGMPMQPPLLAEPSPVRAERSPGVAGAQPFKLPPPGMPMATPAELNAIRAAADLRRKTPVTESTVTAARPVARPQSAAGPSVSESGGTAVLSPSAMVAAPVSGPVGGELCPSCFSEGFSSRGVCKGCGYPEHVENRAGIHLMPGVSLHDRYRIGQLLGQGGFGATYLGWDERLEVKVAVKEYYPANLISRAPGGCKVAPFSDIHAEGFSIGLAKFLEEARTLARLREIKEIVVIHDFFEENATAYLVMELLQGRTLKRYIAESGGTIEARRVLSILSPIMKALQAVHDRGLIHRDVSPDNIFLTANGERKLLDFGAARHAANQGRNLTVILKPGYAPPEQYSQDAKQGPWTDVYAMCATIYCALTGKIPPDATSRFLNDVVPKPSEMGLALPAAFEKVILTGLSMRHSERPQTMRDLLKALTAALGG